MNEILRHRLAVKDRKARLKALGQLWDGKISKSAMETGNIFMTAAIFGVMPDTVQACLNDHKKSLKRK